MAEGRQLVYVVVQDGEALEVYRNKEDAEQHSKWLNENIDVRTFSVSEPLPVRNVLFPGVR